MIIVIFIFIISNESSYLNLFLNFIEFYSVKTKHKHKRYKDKERHTSNRGFSAYCLFFDLYNNHVHINPRVMLWKVITEVNKKWCECKEPRGIFS